MCLKYTLRRQFCGKYIRKKDETIPYYLDVWAVIVLGIVSVFIMLVLVLQRAKYNGLTPLFFEKRNMHQSLNPCSDTIFGNVN